MTGTGSVYSVLRKGICSQGTWHRMSCRRSFRAVGQENDFYPYPGRRLPDHRWPTTIPGSCGNGPRKCVNEEYASSIPMRRTTSEHAVLLSTSMKRSSLEAKSTCFLRSKSRYSDGENRADAEAIARQLNLSQGTVKNHMVRALQFIRRYLARILTSSFCCYLPFGHLLLQI